MLSRRSVLLGSTALLAPSGDFLRWMSLVDYKKWLLEWENIDSYLRSEQFKEFQAISPLTLRPRESPARMWVEEAFEKIHSKKGVSALEKAVGKSPIAYWDIPPRVLRSAVSSPESSSLRTHTEERYTYFYTEALELYHRGRSLSEPFRSESTTFAEQSFYIASRYQPVSRITFQERFQKAVVWIQYQIQETHWLEKAMGSFHTSRIHSLFRDPQKIESILSEYRTSFQTNLTKRQPPLSLGQMIETLEQSLSPYLAPSGFKVIENMIRTEYRLARIFESSHMRSLLTSIEKVSQYTTQTKPLSTQEQQVSFTHFKERLSSDRKKLLNQDLTILTLSEIRAGLPLDTILQTSRIWSIDPTRYTRPRSIAHEMIELVSPDLPPPKKEEIRQQYVSRRDTSMFPEALKGDIISAEKLSNTETLQQISHLLKTNNHSGLGKYIRSLPLADQPAALTLVFRVVAEAFDTNYLKDQNPASIWSTLRDTLRSENPPNGKYQFDSFEADQFEMSHPEHNCVGITLLWSKYIEEKLGFPSRVKNVIRTSYSQWHQSHVFNIVEIWEYSIVGDFTSNRAFFTKTKDLPELGFIGDTESALGGYLSSVLSTLTLSNRDPLNFYKENRKRLKSLALALPENPVRKMFIDRVESFR